MPLCLAASEIAVRLAAAAFTLGWSHSVEHLPWQEDWRVAGGRLVLEEVRVQGSGAGMEPAPEARLEGGWYRWRPEAQSREEIVLRRSPALGGAEGDWQLCLEGQACRPLGALLGPDADPVTLRACR